MFLLFPRSVTVTVLVLLVTNVKTVDHSVSQCQCQCHCQCHYRNIGGCAENSVKNTNKAAERFKHFRSQVKDIEMSTRMYAMHVYHHLQLECHSHWNAIVRDITIDSLKYYTGFVQDFKHKIP